MEEKPKIEIHHDAKACPGTAVFVIRNEDSTAGRAISSQLASMYDAVVYASSEAHLESQKVTIKLTVREGYSPLKVFDDALANLCNQMDHLLTNGPLDKGQLISIAPSYQPVIDQAFSKYPPAKRQQHLSQSLSLNGQGTPSI